MRNSKYCNNRYICDMLKIKVNNNKEFNVSFDNKEYSKGLLNGERFELDTIKVKDNSLHVIKNNRSYNIEVIKADYNEKNFVVLINGNKYHLTIKDKYDELLKSLGFDSFIGNKVKELKAPMPGLVLDIVVSEGSTVKKGDSLLVLEAMKMENNIKSPADGVVKKINIKKGVAVEKNQVLINFV